ncbi:hypothetical protein O9992_07885 [Vibrio lentus]|nr:hypothetical protein [Vibrio lentus]
MAGVSVSLYVMRYARMVQADPTTSIVYDKYEENKAHFLGNASGEKS